jgi:hypothetical protein
MRVRVLLTVLLLGGALVAAGCGGDNLELCDGCGTPVPTVTPTSTAPTFTPFATPSPTPSSTPGRQL